MSPALSFSQAEKEGYLGDQVFTFDADNYLVVTIPIAFELVSKVKTGVPLLGMSIRVDMSMLRDLSIQMRLGDCATAADQRSAQAAALDLSISDAVVRLLECLRSPLEAEILGPAIVREIHYRVLCGKQRGMLCALLARKGRIAEISAVLHWLNANFTKPLEVAQMARTAHMSVSAFHHNFKAVTATSPLQYVKTLRLHRARLLILHDGMSAAAAATCVGYESATQFSREYKRHFGQAPKRQIEAARGKDFISFGSAMVP